MTIFTGSDPILLVPFRLPSLDLIPNQELRLMGFELIGNFGDSALTHILKKAKVG